MLRQEWGVGFQNKKSFWMGEDRSKHEIRYFTQSDALISIFSQPQDCICRRHTLLCRNTGGRRIIMWTFQCWEKPGNHKDVMIEAESI